MSYERNWTRIRKPYLCFVVMFSFYSQWHQSDMLGNTEFIKTILVSWIIVNAKVFPTVLKSTFLFPREILIFIIITQHINWFAIIKRQYYWKTSRLTNVRAIVLVTACLFQIPWFPFACSRGSSHSELNAAKESPSW